MMQVKNPFENADPPAMRGGKNNAVISAFRI